MKRVRTRYAPSPTGYMHIGNLRTALYEYVIAKQAGGDFLLRIEDTDQTRYVEDAVQVIYETLASVGLHHDEGPDVGGNYGPYIQSERLPIYKDYAEKLIALHGAHYCFCKEEDVELQREIAAAKGVAFKFQDPCSKLTEAEIQQKIANQETYVVRQTIPESGKTFFDDEVYGHIEVDNDTLDESILLKSDGYPTYNFANIVDDHLMEISHVVRGNEYLASTPKYNLMYRAFGWDIPTYVHLPPVMKDETHKLSKRNQDASFHDLVKKGYLPEAIINYIALLGWSPEGEKEIFTLSELIEAFDIRHISKSPAIFDIQKLNWMNSQYLRAMSYESFHALILPILKDCVLREVNLEVVTKMLQLRTEYLSQIPSSIDFLNDVLPYESNLFIHKKMKTDETIAKNVLIDCIETIEQLADFSLLHDILMARVQVLGYKNGQYLYPLRIALSGKEFTPGGAIEIMQALGKEESIRRLKLGLAKLI